jgi:hypothetical protein
MDFEAARPFRRARSFDERVCALSLDLFHRSLEGRAGHNVRDDEDYLDTPT